MKIFQNIKRLAYKIFRRTKAFYQKTPARPGAKTFFKLQRCAHNVLWPIQIGGNQHIEDKIWKMLYNQKYGHLNPPLRIIATQDAAYDSWDYKEPRGGIYDNNLNRKFNVQLYSLFEYKPDLKVLDLGCAGGAFVKSFLEDGFTAVGIEGSIVAREFRLHEWDTIPLHLFTADISLPFQVIDCANNKRILFDCITSWDVLEHIREDRIERLIENITAHLQSSGIFVASIDTLPDSDPTQGIDYHLTVHEKDWWIEKFREKGLVPLDSHPFEVRDFVRGNGLSLKDWDPDDGHGFHVVLRKAS